MEKKSAIIYLFKQPDNKNFTNPEYPANLLINENCRIKNNQYDRYSFL